MKKRLYLWGFAFFMIFISTQSMVKTNANTNNNDYLTIHLGDLVIETNYERKDVYTAFFDYDLEEGYKIFDQKTNILLEEFSINKASEKRLTKNISLVEYHHSIPVSDGKTTAMFCSDVTLTIYSSGSFKQINGYNSGTLRALSSGPWAIESPQTAVASTTGRYPTTSVKVLSTGNAVIQYGSAVSAGFSFEFLKNTGFSITSSTSKNEYIRKYISAGYTISLY